MANASTGTNLGAADWGSDFLIVPPGEVIKATQTDEIVSLAPAAVRS